MGDVIALKIEVVDDRATVEQVKDDCSLGSGQGSFSVASCPSFFF